MAAIIIDQGDNAWPMFLFFSHCPLWLPGTVRSAFFRRALGREGQPHRRSHRTGCWLRDDMQCERCHQPM